MKNFKYLKIVFALFLFFVLAGSAKADLASTKALYLARIDDKQAAVQAQIDRIASLSYINATAQTQLTNNFNSYNTNYLVDLETQINASSTEDEVIDLINSDWQLPYMVLVKSMFNYNDANIVAGNIQTGYQLINDTRTFVAGYTTGGEYSLLKNCERQFVLKWDFIKAAYVAGTGWTCRQHDGVSAKVCASQDNLQKQACFWLDEFQKCVGDDQLGAEMAINGDGDAVTCAEISGHNKLKDCYENNKCAANGLLEEYVLASTCGNGILDFGEECDDGNSVDAIGGDLCYNDCTKRYLDELSTQTALDVALTELDDYESAEVDSLDVNTSSMDTLLTNIYNVYNQAITENEKLVLMTGYEQSLEALYTSTQNVSSNIVTEVANILAL